MSTPLFTKDSVDIAASAARVWEILTTPSWMQKWWSIPVEVEGGLPLAVGTKMTWKDANGTPIVNGTVLQMEPMQSLTIAVHSPPDGPPPVTPADFTHAYALVDVAGKTQLSLMMGDFAKIPKGEEHFAEARGFKGTELKKIKELAEAQ